MHLKGKNNLILESLLLKQDNICIYHEGEQLPACTLYHHKMNPNTNPWKQMKYRYNLIQQEAIDQKIKEMLTADIIEKLQFPTSVLELRASNKYVIILLHQLPWMMLLMSCQKLQSISPDWT